MGGKDRRIRPTYCTIVGGNNEHSDVYELKCLTGILALNMFSMSFSFPHLFAPPCYITLAK